MFISKNQRWAAIFVGTSVLLGNLTTVASSEIAGDVEPPRNPYLADSPWPMTHRNPYNQASSPLPGPVRANQAEPQLLPGSPVPITLAVTSPYPNGKSAMWGTTTSCVFKVDCTSATMEYIDQLPREQSRSEAISGAYSVLDCDGNYFVPKGLSVECYRDRVQGLFSSPIEHIDSLVIPARLRTDGDAIIGVNLTYDGWLTFATRQGVVGCVSRDFAKSHYLRLPKELIQTEISNSTAVDESGGIFVVTNQNVHRIQWNSPHGLRHDWAVSYRSDNTRRPGRLGTGSGTTPTLMGTGNQDRFIAICDGQDLMHVVLIWRDEVPGDWHGLPGRDHRIAAEVPVRFGSHDAVRSTTEQSLTVRGYELVTVSNLYGELSPLTRRFARRLRVDPHYATIYRSNHPEIAPYGIEKFTWDPERRTLVSCWANSELSCPNGVPAMSAATGLLYCVGQRDGHWTLEGVDWHDGRSVFHRKLARKTAHNSFYAATEIGGHGSIVSGSFGGMLRFSRTNGASDGWLAAVGVLPKK